MIVERLRWRAEGVDARSRDREDRGPVERRGAGGVLVALLPTLSVAESIERGGVLPRCAPGGGHVVSICPRVEQERAFVAPHAGDQDRERARVTFEVGAVPAGIGACSRAAAGRG